MKRHLLAAPIIGFTSGLLVLGIGGRLLMRLLAFLTPEVPRFTWVGTLQIVGLGAVWGLFTGPFIGIAAKRLRRPLVFGAVFGLVVFILAAVPFLLYSGFQGPLVAPLPFLWLGGISFPLLFVLYGVMVGTLWNRYRPAA